MKDQTFSGLVRTQLVEIERQLEAGFSQQSILEYLEQHGFKTTLKTFRSTLFRVRQRAIHRGNRVLVNTSQLISYEAVPVNAAQIGMHKTSASRGSKKIERAQPGAFNQPKTVDIDEFKVNELPTPWNPLTRISHN